MKTVNDLLNLFGGTCATARELSLPVSTVHNWTVNGFPAKRAIQVQKKLAKLGHEIGLEKLLSLKTEKSG